MKTENVLTVWREKLAITQQALAEYFGISRSHLSMIELGERELPTSAVVDFYQLVSHYEETPPEALMQYTPKEKTAVLEMLQRKMKDDAWKLEKCKQELARIEKDYLASQSALKNLRNKQSQLVEQPNDRAREGKRLWLSIREEEALQRIARTGAVARRELAYTIKTLQASLQIAQQEASEIQ